MKSRGWGVSSDSVKTSQEMQFKEQSFTKQAGEEKLILAEGTVYTETQKAGAFEKQGAVKCSVKEGRWTVGGQNLSGRTLVTAVSSGDLLQPD